MTDRTTKVLLAAIAVGLWANVWADWLKPEPVYAQDTRTLRELENIARSLRSIDRELESGSISRSVQETAGRSSGSPASCVPSRGLSAGSKTAVAPAAFVLMRTRFLPFSLGRCSCVLGLRRSGPRARPALARFWKIRNHGPLFWMPLAHSNWALDLGRNNPVRSWLPL